MNRFVSRLGPPQKDLAAAVSAPAAAGEHGAVGRENATENFARVPCEREHVLRGRQMPERADSPSPTRPDSIAEDMENSPEMVRVHVYTIPDQPGQLQSW